jgi:hypothetical protein
VLLHVPSSDSQRRRLAQKHHVGRLVVRSRVVNTDTRYEQVVLSLAVRTPPEGDQAGGRARPLAMLGRLAVEGAEAFGALVISPSLLMMKSRLLK